MLHTAVGPAGNGTSQPTAESTLRNLEAEGYQHALDTEQLALVSGYFEQLVRDKALPAGEPREYDAAYYHHQLPGGMVTTTRRMLEEIRRPELFDAVLDEVVRVRAEMGYPILVTPVSQLVAFHATRNVIDPERWLNVSDETVRYFLGHFGAFAAPPDPDVTDRVLSLPKVEALRDARPVGLDGARERFGRRISDEELLLRLTMPQSRWTRCGQRRRSRATRAECDGEPCAARPAPPRSSGGRRSRTSGCRRATTWWCGAVRLDGVRGFVFDVDGTLVHRARRGAPHPWSERGARAAPGDRNAVRSSRTPATWLRRQSRPERDAGLPVGDEQLLTPLRPDVSPTVSARRARPPRS